MNNRKEKKCYEKKAERIWWRECHTHATQFISFSFTFIESCVCFVSARCIDLILGYSDYDCFIPMECFKWIFLYLFRFCFIGYSSCFIHCSVSYGACNCLSVALSLTNGFFGSSSLYLLRDLVSHRATVNFLSHSYGRRIQFFDASKQIERLVKIHFEIFFVTRFNKFSAR